jgi:hypothetical protein
MVWGGSSNNIIIVTHMQNTSFNILIIIGGLFFGTYEAAAINQERPKNVYLGGLVLRPSHEEHSLNAFNLPT